MIDSLAFGQGKSRSSVDDVRAALVTLTEAVARLNASQHLALAPLVEPYLALGPAGHREANAPRIDLMLLARSLALVVDPTLLGASRFVLSTLDAPTLPTVCKDGDSLVLTLQESDHACADALAFALGLVVERAKAKRLLGDMPSSSVDVTARLLGVSVLDLVSLFGDAETAMKALASLTRGASHATVHRAPVRAPRNVDDSALERASGTGPLFIVAGASERLHDVLSPLVRRIDQQLTALAGAPDDDLLYASLGQIFTRDPLAHEERLTVEERDGITRTGAHLIVRCRALDVGLVDARARSFVEKLAANDATLVVAPRDARALDEILARVGSRARAVILLDEGFTDAGAPFFPDVVTSATSTHACENPFAPPRDPATRARVAFSAPGLGLAPTTPPDTAPAAVSCSLLSSMLDVLARARARGEVHRACRTACAIVLPGDDAAASLLALACLEKMAASSPRV